MVEVELTRIVIDEKRQEQMVVLKEKDGPRKFPIIIGFQEASSIKMKLANVPVTRPMTHDLLVSVIQGLDAVLEKVVIDKIVDNTFHAQLMIKDASGKTHGIDSRSSDGIAVAVRAGAPIFVEEEVLAKTSFLKSQ